MVVFKVFIILIVAVVVMSIVAGVILGRAVAISSINSNVRAVIIMKLFVLTFLCPHFPRVSGFVLACFFSSFPIFLARYVKFNFPDILPCVTPGTWYDTIVTVACVF